MIKTDAEAVSSNTEVLCDQLESTVDSKKQKREKNLIQSTSTSIKKKRGRPRGSKNPPSENYSGMEKESGYR